MSLKAAPSALLVALTILFFQPNIGRANASPSRTPGPQVEPPGPPQVATAPLQFDDGQRRAIRGCSVGIDCKTRRIQALIEFEREAFGKPGQSPWVDGDNHRGRNARPRRQSGNPLDLRPDLPWLANLEMPDLPVKWDHRIIRYLEFYKNDPRGRNIMGAWLKAQGRYRDMIVAELRRAKLPTDLLYVSMIESSYDAMEYSRVGASGLWQFMPAGGRIYGLEINRWLDERNDPLRSTKAVVHYWTDLYQRFGNWNLAMAAYNAGYGAVLKSMSKYNTNDYWKLLEYENGLPWASSIYVPKALAAAIVGHNRKVFGYDQLTPAPAETYDSVTVPKSISLSVIARAAGTTTDTIKRLNPQILRGRTPPAVRDYVVRIPRGKRNAYAQRIVQLRGDWDNYDAYLVAHGQRFEDIATMHGISRSKLRTLNGIKSESEVRGGMTLVVPRVDEQTKKANLAKAHASLYTSGVPAGKPGDKLVVALPNADAAIKGRKRLFYRVVSGDSQYSIARAFGVDQRSLARWNGLDAQAHIHPRMVLAVWVKPNFDADKASISVLDPRRILVVDRGSQDHLDESERRVGRRRVVYKAKRNETLEQVGRRYGLTKYDLARINKLKPSTTLTPGQDIVVYEVVDRKASQRAEDQAKAARRHGPRTKRSSATTTPKPAKAPAKATPVKAAPAKATPVKAAPAKAAPPKEAPPKEAPPKAAPATDAPPEKASPPETKAAPAKESKADLAKDPVEEAPTNGPEKKSGAPRAVEGTAASAPPPDGPKAELD